ncbi:transposase, partial [Patescibacteria group bacterium]|nr:transposase [Patescibacteria group bacterium]
MERKFRFSEGEFYHLYNRGINKMAIFLNNIDKKRFIKLLFACNSKKPVVFKNIQGLPLEEIERGETIVDIGAYCLMPNHFHLLVREKTENGISMFMEKLFTAYSMYFNKKNERTGRLFEGIFKATHANKDQYLKYLFAYIHLNPVKLIDLKWKENSITDKEKAKKFLKEYAYSSYLDY